MTGDIREDAATPAEIERFDSLQTVDEIHAHIRHQPRFEATLADLLRQEIGNTGRLIANDPDSARKMSELEAEMAAADELEKCRFICGSMGTLAEFRDTMAQSLLGADPDRQTEPEDTDEIAF